MKFIPLIIISTIASLSILGMVNAKSHGSEKYDPEKHIIKVTEKLSLNETQQNHLRAFVDEKQALKQARHAQYATKKADDKKGQRQSPFADILEKETISINDINQAIDEAQAKKREKNQAILSSFVTFYNSLSAEQREEAKPMLKKMLQRAMGRSHKKRSKKKHNHDS